MNLLDIVHRQSLPKPWTEGGKIPWDDPDFSRRMLQWHFPQGYDAASRRSEIIDRHVQWIHAQVLQGKPSHVLDLGCGPGLYTSRLAKLGHVCVGMDFSPASIAYAQEQPEEARRNCTYFLEDIRTADYGEGVDLVMLIYGEFNAFRPEEAKAILEKAWRALVPGGILLLEPHPFEYIARMGEQPPSWYSAEQGLFSDLPHLYLQESFWEAEGSVAIKRIYVIDAGTGGVACHSENLRAYTEAQYRSLMLDCGFCEVEFHVSLDGSVNNEGSDFIVILSKK
jgi:SAM-dependent methyltransferase